MEEVSAVAAEQPPGVEDVDGRSRETLDHLEDVVDLAAELPDEDEGDPVGEALDDNLYAELHQGLPAHGAPHFFSDDLLDVGVVHVLPHQPAAVAEGAPRTPGLFVRRRPLPTRADGLWLGAGAIHGQRPSAASSGLPGAPHPFGGWGSLP